MISILQANNKTKVIFCKSYHLTTFSRIRHDVVHIWNLGAGSLSTSCVLNESPDTEWHERIFRREKTNLGKVLLIKDIPYTQKNFCENVCGDIQSTETFSILPIFCLQYQRLWNTLFFQSNYCFTGRLFFSYWCSSQRFINAVSALLEHLALVLLSVTMSCKSKVIQKGPNR